MHYFVTCTRYKFQKSILKKYHLDYRNSRYSHYDLSFSSSLAIPMERGFQFVDVVQISHLLYLGLFESRIGAREFWSHREQNRVSIIPKWQALYLTNRGGLNFIDVIFEDHRIKIRNFLWRGPRVSGLLKDMDTNSEIEGSGLLPLPPG